MQIASSNKISPTDFSARIEQHARELGFHKIGIVRAENLTAERARLEEWLAHGFHGEMRWMANDTERRTDPRALLEDARSIVVVALNYFTPQQHEDVETESANANDEKLRGKISRYAWGDDYHDVVSEKLRALFAWIQSEIPNARGKVCVDAQPMMDKAWAVRAGLGWIGKHSNLITREYGSWVFLGELILNLELDYDTEPVPDHCGTCTLCLEACPTGAIVESRVVDSRKCISYATIELRDEQLPQAIAQNLDDWLYGCDVCQDVCPWNRFEQATNEQRFAPREDETALELERLLQLTPDEYAARFRKSAIKRAKLAGLKRNARTLLENAKRVADERAKTE
ncbi:MAG: tRNA epoxyqueuosine(34) reductase QueG [Pyrinomonadaceae bacterium]